MDCLTVSLMSSLKNSDELFKLLHGEINVHIKIIVLLTHQLMACLQLVIIAMHCSGFPHSRNLKPAASRSKLDHRAVGFLMTLPYMLKVMCEVLRFHQE